MGFAGGLVCLFCLWFNGLSVYRLLASTFLFALPKNKGTKQKRHPRAPKTPTQLLKLTAVQMRHPWRN